MQQLAEDGPVANPRAVASQRVGWIVDGPLRKQRRELVPHRGSVRHDGKAGTGRPVITERRNPVITRTCASSSPEVSHRAYLRDLLVPLGRETVLRVMRRKSSAQVTSWPA